MRFKSETRSSNPVKPALVATASKMKKKCSKLSYTTITNIRLLGKITSFQTSGNVCLGSHHLISSSYIQAIPNYRLLLLCVGWWSETALLHSSWLAYLTETIPCTWDFSAYQTFWCGSYVRLCQIYHYCQLQAHITIRLSTAARFQSPLVIQSTASKVFIIGSC